MTPEIKMHQSTPVPLSRLKGAEVRFWLKVFKGDGDDACWTWTASTLGKGYGQFPFEGERLAHRFSFFLANGYWPPVVRHRCNNPPCVRPEHLLAGTVADNNRDMREAGRQARGERNGMAKLTAADVLIIRASDAPQSELATQFGVVQSAISNIRSGERWGHVDAA